MSKRNYVQKKKLDFIVEIKDAYRSTLPFGNLKSRFGTVTVLSYFGDCQKVYDLM